VPVEAFCELMRSSFTERATGQLGDLTATLDELCRRLGHSPGREQLAQAVALRVMHERTLAAPRRGALAVLAELRDRGYRLGIVTDCSSELLSGWGQGAYAAAVDGVSFSSEVGHRKPHRSMYLAVCRQLGVEPTDCLYVGDGASHELTGATNVGMTAIWLETGLPSRLRYDADAEEHWEGPSIHTLEELLSIVPFGASSQ
jgi:putative hydrolase of the HAD superfamily